MNKFWKQVWPFLFVFLFAEKGLQSQNLIWEEFIQYQNDSASLGAFYEQVISLDQLLESNAVPDSLKQYDQTFAFFSAPRNGKISARRPLEFELTQDQKMVFDFLLETDNLQTLEGLKEEGKLNVKFRGLASHVDPLPAASSNMQGLADLYLNTIRIRIANYSDRLPGVTFESYQEKEREASLLTVFAILKFRRDFLLYLYEKFKIPD